MGYDLSKLLALAGGAAATAALIYYYRQPAKRRAAEAKAAEASPAKTGYGAQPAAAFEALASFSVEALAFGVQMADIFALFPSERKWSLQGENDISVCPLTADLAGCTPVHRP